MSRSAKLCPHLHIPIQSGDDQILKKMKRRYSRRFYLNLIKKVKSKVPQISITTDCLIGFPGESEGNFKNTLSLVEKIMPLKVHIFPYSLREGTFAGDNFRNCLASGVVKERIHRLKVLADSCAVNYKKRFLGKKMPVLFESLVKGKNGYWQGYTDNYIRVLFKSRSKLKNKVKMVRLDSRR
jgi:threonylcarbamoyladenosine tRNA methylthiotransferase MtaB